jgi:hypothetical protein
LVFLMLLESWGLAHHYTWRFDIKSVSQLGLRVTISASRGIQVAIESLRRQNTVEKDEYLSQLQVLSYYWPVSSLLLVLTWFFTANFVRAVQI